MKVMKIQYARTPVGETILTEGMLSFGSIFTSNLFYDQMNIVRSKTVTCPESGNRARLWIDSKENLAKFLQTLLAFEDFAEKCKLTKYKYSLYGTNIDWCQQFKEKGVVNLSILRYTPVYGAQLSEVDCTLENQLDSRRSNLLFFGEYGKMPTAEPEDIESYLLEVKKFQLAFESFFSVAKLREVLAA